MVKRNLRKRIILHITKLNHCDCDDLFMLLQLLISESSFSVILSVRKFGFAG